MSRLFNLLGIFAMLVGVLGMFVSCSSQSQPQALHCC